MRKRMVELTGLLRRNEAGSAAVEFAFIGTLLVFLTIGTFELGRIIYTHYSLLKATGPAIRMVGMGIADQAIEDRIRSHFSASEQSALTVDIQAQMIGGLPYKRVDAQFVLPLIMPNFGLVPGNSLPIRAVQLIPTN